MEFSGIESFRPGKLNILQPDCEQEYLRVEGSPIAKNPEILARRVREIFKGKPMEDLMRARRHIGVGEQPLQEAVKNEMKLREETMRRKNAAVEIQID